MTKEQLQDMIEKLEKINLTSETWSTDIYEHYENFNWLARCGDSLLEVFDEISILSRKLVNELEKQQPKSELQETLKKVQEDINQTTNSKEDHEESRYNYEMDLLRKMRN